MWQLLNAFFGASKQGGSAAATARTSQAEEVCIMQAVLGDVRNHNEMQDARFWDAWWDDCISKGEAGRFMFPMLEAPLVKHAGGYYDVANSNALRMDVMAQFGLRKILCAGSGISQEPRALAQAGFDVTALDLSPKALAVASAFEPRADDRLSFCGGVQRPGGQLNFVVGSILDLTVCPGPFDVIIERRTISRFREQDRSTALQALAERLGKVGIFLSHCNDSYRKSEKWFHASEAWFREQNWAIWDGVPNSTLAGRVAWLVRSAA